MCFLDKNEVKVAYLEKIYYFCTAFTKAGRDGGIGRHEGLKILWPEMAVWVQVPLAVQKTRIRKCSRFCCKALVKRLWGYVISTRGTKDENTKVFSFFVVRH